MSRRTRSFDWTTAPDEGDAAAASRAIDAWSAAQGGPRDWDGVMGPMRDALTRLALSPRVQGDARCRAILDGLAAAAEMAAVEAAAAALAHRVDEMDAARGPALTEAPRPARRTIRI